MMTVIKCFSVLVASGNGARCIELRNTIRDQLLAVDPGTGQLKVTIHKYGKKTNPDSHRQISQEVAKKISPIFTDIDDHYFCSDNGRQQPTGSN